LTEKAQNKKDRKLKLNLKAHIGYLVGYDSTNIFRVWIPHQGRVISTRDVMFDESTRFDGKRENLIDSLIKERDELIERVQMPEALAINERIIQEDDDLLNDEDTIVVDTGDYTGDQWFHDEARDQSCGPDQWPTPPQTPIEDILSAFSVLPVKGMLPDAYQGAPPDDPQGVRIPEPHAYQGAPPDDSAFMVLPVKGMPLHAYQGAPPEDLQEVRIPELYAH